MKCHHDDKSKKKSRNLHRIQTTITAFGMVHCKDKKDILGHKTVYPPGCQHQTKMVDKRITLKTLCQSF